MANTVNQANKPQSPNPVGGENSPKNASAKGSAGGVHERMAAPEPRLGVVRQRAGERVRDGIENERDEQRQAGQRAGQFEHLVVVEQDE